ncbi:MAG: effector-associated domain EAD1-containing protein [Cyanobacteria bacterium J06621_8]
MSRYTDLISVANTEIKNRTADIIFVHGLGGDALDTWRHPNNNNPDNFWLKWLGRDLPEMGIWSLAYEVEPMRWKGNTMALIDRATNSLDLLEINSIGKRPTFFVTHSMGGLLVKQMLRNAHDSGNDAWLQILKNTQGIVYLATPHAGSAKASFLKSIKADILTSISVKELEAHDSRLLELNRVYRNNETFNQIPMKVYAEDKPMRLIGMIVDKSSADPGISGVNPILLKRNHIDIAKPESPEDRLYQGVKHFITDNIAKIPQSLASYSQINAGTTGQVPREKVNNNKMNLRDLIKNGILQELASSCNEKAMAELLLNDINFPGHMRPIFPTQGTTLGYWQEICQQIQNGIVPNGNDLQSLVDAAADYYPSNAIFQNYRS